MCLRDVWSFPYFFASHPWRVYTCVGCNHGGFWGVLACLNGAFFGLVLYNANVYVCWMGFCGLWYVMRVVLMDKQPFMTIWRTLNEK